MILLPVEHGQDEKRGGNEHLHVCHQVPSLTHTAPFLGEVGYVEDQLPPMFRTSVANILVVGCKLSFCHYVLCQCDVEANHKGERYGQSEV